MNYLNYPWSMLVKSRLDTESPGAARASSSFCAMGLPCLRRPSASSSIVIVFVSSRSSDCAALRAQAAVAVPTEGSEVRSRLQQAIHQHSLSHSPRT